MSERTITEGNNVLSSTERVAIAAVASYTRKTIRHSDEYDHMHNACMNMLEASEKQGFLSNADIDKLYQSIDTICDNIDGIEFLDRFIVKPYMEAIRIILPERANNES